MGLSKMNKSLDKIKVCYFSSYYIKDYTRTQVIINGLKKNNVEVIECIDNSKSILRYPRAIIKFLKLKDNFDLVIVGFRGHEIMPIIRKLTKKPIIFDAFLSSYDTMCFDRKKFKPNSFFGKFFFWLDKYDCTIADKVLLETKQHVDYFVKTFEININKFDSIYVGADEDMFFPQNKEKSNKFIVFYYGTYRPLQGIEYIIKAAKLLEKDKDILFRLIGGGKHYDVDYYNSIKKLTKDLNIKNIEFVDWIPYKKIPEEISKADICLGGHFSNIDKASRVIAGKTFQFIAMKKPTIVGENKANKSIFLNRKNVYMCKIADEKSLAKAIVELKDNPKLKSNIANNGYRLFVEKYSSKAIGKDLKEIIFNLK